MPFAGEINTTKVTDEWIMIYRFKNMMVLRFITRLKIYQTFITVALSGYSLYQYANDAQQWSETIRYSLISAFALTMLLVMGRLARRVIGIVYVNKGDPGLIRLAHMNFWGKRVNRDVPIQEILPLSDTNIKSNHFLRLHVEKNADHFYISPRHALFDSAAFSRVFGNV